MASEFNFHGDDNYFRQCSENSITRAQLRNEICEDDARYIREYLSERLGQNRIGMNRYKKLAIALCKNGQYFDRPFADCEYSDILEAINRLKTSKKRDGTPKYAKTVISERVWALKNFFIWLIDNGYNTKINPRKISLIKLPKHEVTTVTEADLPTVEEVCQIISSATSIRDKCLLSFMYDGSMRFGDVCGLRFRDLRVMDDAIIVHTNYKTNRDRTIPLYNCNEVFRAWMSVYPSVHVSDDFVFCHLNDKNQCLTYRGARKAFDTACIRAGLADKGFTPHKFRHARITQLLRDGMSESTLKLLAWGGDSNAIRVYNHLTSTDVETEMARVQGIKRGTQSDSMHCAICGAPVTPLDHYCPTCYANLDVIEHSITHSKGGRWTDILHEIEDEKMRLRL